MFNTAILDVAIGMVFIYLLLSLMCTAANEIIELALKKRAVDLERGIRELLAPGSKSGTDDVVKKIYNHPLVNSLFGGKYEESRIQNVLQRKVMRTALPSYIPSQTFALALMDLVLPGVTASPAGAGPAGAAAPPTPTPSGAAGATPPAANFVNLAAPPPPPIPITDPNNPLARLRNAVGVNAYLTEHARNALTPLIDAAGSDVAKARENIESWYNSSMDRVSSWYKRRAQVTILILGLLVAIAVNADSIAIARRLSTDRSLRESLVAAAQEYAKAHASTPAATTPSPISSPAASPSPSSSPAASPGATPVATPSASSASPQTSPDPASSPASGGSSIKAPECASDATSPACRYATLLLTIPECVRDKSSAECRYEAGMQMIKACEKVASRTSPECKYELNKQQLESLGLPIGWDSIDDPQRKWPGSNLGGEGGWLNQIYWHWLGWLLTALAISLGAPFWFDLLNKFIVIRSAVKPHEKSPEEGSKD